MRQPFVVPPPGLDEFTLVVRRVEKYLPCTVSVRGRTFEIQRVVSLADPSRAIYVAIGSGPPVVGVSVTTLLGELYTVISSGQWDEFDVDPQTDPSVALDGVSSSFFGDDVSIRDDTGSRSTSPVRAAEVRERLLEAGDRAGMIDTVPPRADSTSTSDI